MSSAIGPSGDRHGHRHPSVVRGGGGAHGAARSDGSAEALLDAIVAISSDLDTRSVLERIVAGGPGTPAARAADGTDAADLGPGSHE